MVAICDLFNYYCFAVNPFVHGTESICTWDRIHMDFHPSMWMMMKDIS